MTLRCSLIQTAFCAFGLAALLGACGGRVQTTRQFDDDTAGSGGAPSAGRGGSVQGRAGASTGGTGIGGSRSVGASGGGTSSSAGSGGGDGCRFAKCLPLKCLGGQQPLTEPGQCCPTQCSACPPCPMLQCPTGYHNEVAAGDCCPHCAPDMTMDACVKGQQEYRKVREQMAEKYSYGCASDSECVIVAPATACEFCSYAAIWYGLTDSFESNLSNLAAMQCSTCPVVPIPPCVPLPVAASCKSGRCSL
jgi:hypothetical protein